MTKNDKNKEINLNEVAITLEVDSGLIEQVRSGEITHLGAQWVQAHLRPQENE